MRAVTSLGAVDTAQLVEDLAGLERKADALVDRVLALGAIGVAGDFLTQSVHGAEALRDRLHELRLELDLRVVREACR
jgi:hypothetical protein